jgi:hypothetical protein
VIGILLQVVEWVKNYDDQVLLRFSCSDWSLKGTEVCYDFLQMRAGNRSAMKRNAWRIALILCGLTGGISVLYAMNYGVGVSPDSTGYIGVAREWLSRLGFLFNGGPGADFPPLYSTLLALGSLVTRADPLETARWMNALVFTINIVGVGLILRASLPGSTWIPLLGAGFMLTSLDMIKIHTMAWSESSFLALTLLGVYLLAACVERPSGRRLVFASGVVALGWLDRYAGVVLVLTGITALFLWSHREIKHRIRVTLVFAVTASLPMLIWTLLNPSVRKLALHTFPAEWIVSGLQTIAGWVVPEEIVMEPLARGLIALAAFSFVFVMIYERFRYPVGANRINAEDTRIVRLLPLFMLYYGMVLFVTRLFLDAAIPLDARLLSPIFMVVLIGVLYLAGWLVHSNVDRFPSSRIALCGFALVVGGFYFISSWRIVESIHEEGRGFTSRDWQQSEIMREVRALPPGTLIYSNGDDAIYILAAVPAARVPDRVNGYTLLPNPDYAVESAQARKQMLKDGVLVYFDRLKLRWFLPTEDDLVTEWNLQPVVHKADGTIYKLAP